MRMNKDGSSVSSVDKVSLPVINWNYKKKGHANKQLGPWHFKKCLDNAELIKLKRRKHDN